MASVKKFFMSNTLPSIMDTKVNTSDDKTSSDMTDNTKSRAGSPLRAPRENVLQLLGRLQHVHGDLIHIYVSEYDTEPIFVQEGLLRLVFRGSVWFKHTMERMDMASTNELVSYTQRDVLAIFMFFVYHTRVPGLHEVGQYASIPTQDDEDDYQALLVRTWVFADSIELPGLQNALMGELFDGFDNPAKDLTAETLQICLLVSESGTIMRLALLQYLLWWEHQSQRGMNDYEPTPHPRLQPYINLEQVERIEADLKSARALWDMLDSEQRRKRPIARMFLVPDLQAVNNGGWNATCA